MRGWRKGDGRRRGHPTFGQIIVELLTFIVATERTRESSVDV